MFRKIPEDLYDAFNKIALEVYNNGTDYPIRLNSLDKDEVFLLKKYYPETLLKKKDLEMSDFSKIRLENYPEAFCNFLKEENEYYKKNYYQLYDSIISALNRQEIV